jgi:FemAB-related protein (PEP-CTERM system-associated)
MSAAESALASRASTVAPLAAAEESEWEAFVREHPDSTIYHSLAWRDVTREGLGHEPRYLRARDADGRVSGVLPLFLVKGLFGRRLVSVPMRDRGGVVARDVATASALVESAIALRDALRCKYLELRSLTQMSTEVVAANGLTETPHWITTRIDLTPGADVLWKRLDKDAVRWAVNRARRYGLVVTVDDSPAAADLFYELFVKTRCAMGIPPFPRELFRAIHRHLVVPGRAICMIVRKGDVPVHGLISFISGDTLIPAYAAPQNAYRKENPTDLLIWEAVAWACAHGFSTLDFGADSPRQTGLLRFKSKWGGVQHPMHYYVQAAEGRALPNFDSSSPTFELARRLWRRLPVSIARPLGAWTTRQLS